jgi:type I restriction enzyme S subunit
MKSETWRKITLGELTEWGSGGTPSKSNPSFWSGDIPWISASSMKTSRLSDSEQKITEQGLDDGSRLADKNSILLLVRGSELHKRIPVGIATRPVAFNQDVKSLKARPGLLPEFLLYWILAAEPLLLSKVEHTGIGAGKLDTDVLKNLKIELPKESEQQAIVTVLSALDEKIELNRQINETLDDLARNLFKSRFVDIPQKMPKGWNVRALYDCADYVNGAAFRNEHFSADRQGLPVVKIGELKDGITAQTKFCEVEREPKYRIASGDILFSWSGSPDTSIDIFVWTGGDGWLNQHIFKIQFKRPVEKYFVYYLLRHLKPVFIEIARDKQTTGLGHVTGQDLKRLKTAFPPDDVLQEFNQVAEPLFQNVYSNLCESRTLAELRDALLPKLLSGELRVPKTLEIA